MNKNGIQNHKTLQEQLEQVRETTGKIAEKYRNNSTIVKSTNKEVSQR